MRDGRNKGRLSDFLPCGDKFTGGAVKRKPNIWDTTRIFKIFIRTALEKKGSVWELHNTVQITEECVGRKLQLCCCFVFGYLFSFAVNATTQLPFSPFLFPSLVTYATSIFFFFVFVALRPVVSNIPLITVDFPVRCTRRSKGLANGCNGRKTTCSWDV